MAGRVVRARRSAVLARGRSVAGARGRGTASRWARGVGAFVLAVAAVVGAAVIFAVATPATAWGAGSPLLSLDLGQGDGNRLGTGIELVILFSLLSFAPALLIGLSAFVRIAIVLAFLRQAVGTQSMPPNQVVVALALFLTFFVMTPTLRQIHEDAVVPYLDEKASATEAIASGFQPLRTFMLRQTREKDLALFLGMGGKERPENADAVPAEVVIPAFLISELKSAFQISFMVYIPFLVLDMAVAAILTSMGMITLPPVLISLPFKLMVFVLVDGWNLLVTALVKSFH
jgi:flagellar biosynthetic protein FliP